MHLTILNMYQKDVCVESLGAQLKRIVEQFRKNPSITYAEAKASRGSRPPSASEMTPARSNSARSAPAETCEKAGGQNGSHDFLDKIDAETFPGKGTSGQRKSSDPCLNLDPFFLPFFFSLL